MRRLVQRWLVAASRERSFGGETLREDPEGRLGRYQLSRADPRRPVEKGDQRDRPLRFLRGLLRSAIRSELRISFSPDTTLVTIEPGLFCSAERALLRRSFRGILLCASAHLSECLVRGDLRGATASDGYSVALAGV